MAEFNAEELDAIEDALEALDFEEPTSVADLVPNELKGNSALTGRLQEYAAIMRDAGQAMPPVEASTTVLSAIIDAGREACASKGSAGLEVDASAEAPSASAATRPRWWWWLTACASAVAVVFAVQVNDSSQNESSFDSPPIAAKSAIEEAGPARKSAAEPTDLAAADDLARLQADPQASALLVPGADGASSKKSALPRGAGIRDVSDLEVAAPEPPVAIGAHRAKSAGRSRGPRYGDRSPSRSKRSKKSRAYDDLARPEEQTLPQSKSKPSSLGGLSRAAKKKKTSLGAEAKAESGAIIDRNQAQRQLNQADLARQAQRCSAAKPKYKELLRRLRAQRADWARRYRAQAEAGLGLCDLLVKKRKSAETHFRKARSHWPSVAASIDQERQSMGE